MQRGLQHIVCAIAFGLAGCAAEDVGSEAEALSLDRGDRLFHEETFGGNGRTCATCHGDESGTISHDEATAAFLAQPPILPWTQPANPLFRAIDSDEGLGLTYVNLTSRAVFRVTIPLPENVVMLDDPTAREVTLNRSSLSVMNVALEPVLMWDGRQPNLEHQALAAVNAHYEPGRLPSARERREIADFQRRTFFSSEALRDFHRTGRPPELPPGNTPSEIRGRDFFVEQPFDGTSSRGICAVCHSGPMLNEISPVFPVSNGVPCILPALGDACPSTENPPVPVASRFFTDFVSEMNEGANPTHIWQFTDPDGTQHVYVSPDPGRGLITGRWLDADFFKIPSLWGIGQTAPYFHDGSARTLEDIVAHYARFFAIAFFGRIVLTEQEQADIVAYMRLL